MYEKGLFVMINCWFYDIGGVVNIRVVFVLLKLNEFVNIVWMFMDLDVLRG